MRILLVLSSSYPAAGVPCYLTFDFRTTLFRPERATRKAVDRSVVPLAWCKWPLCCI